MEKFKLENMFGGWFLGNFTPTVSPEKDFEVAIKKYKAGDLENPHYHKIATEYTVIVEGEVEMSGIKYITGDIIKITPGIPTDFKALTNVITVVVKTPSVQNDKFIINEKN